MSSFARFESAISFMYCIGIQILCHNQYCFWTQQEAVFVYISQKLTGSYFILCIYIVSQPIFDSDCSTKE